MVLDDTWIECEPLLDLLARNIAKMYKLIMTKLWTIGALDGIVPDTSLLSFG